MLDQEYYFDENLNKFFVSKDGKSYEEIFKEIKDDIKDDWIFYQVNNVDITISKNSKYIKFIKEQKITDIFIVNASQVYFLLDKFKYKHYLLDGKDTNTIILNDNLNFNTITYLDNLLFIEDFKKAKEDIKTKKKILLEDLSLKYYDYQKIKIIKSEFILTQEREDFYKKLKYLCNIKRFIPICGPKYIGKTTSLLYFLKTYARNKYFYINLNYCKKLFNDEGKEELYLCICKELFNCMPFEEVKKIYNSFFIQNFKNIMDIVIYCIKYLNEKFPFISFYVLIDQYKEKIDANYKIINEIEKMTKLYNKFTILVCSSINECDFRNSLNKYFKNSKEFYLDYLFINKLITIKNKKLEKEELNNNELNLLEASGDLFNYYYKIKQNKIFEKSEEYTKNEIMSRIIEKINEYFSESDLKKKISKIRNIHDNIYKKIKFIDLKENLSLFPFKFFNLLINDQNMFIIDELTNETEIVITPSYPIVIDCINEIFYQSKYELKKCSSNETTINTENLKKSSELEENFNDYLWFNRFNYEFNNCKIIDKIIIDSLMDMNQLDGKKIENAAKELNIVSQSILITQKFQKDRHYDTAILKLNSIIENEKYFELYLFQETLNKDADERLLNLTLNEDKIFLKYNFFIFSAIKIENIYFSYVFDNNNLDSATIKYCKEANINYLKFDDKLKKIIDSKIDSIIRPKFQYPIRSKSKIKKLPIDYPLEVLDINFLNNKNELKEQYNKLNNFLNKKRNFKKDEIKKIEDSIKKKKEYVKNSFRNYEIIENSVEEYLMNQEKEEIIGISYIIDEETKKAKSELNFSEEELKNLYYFMNNYNYNVEILKIIKLNQFIISDIPNYDCCILQINEKKEKIYIDIKNKIKYSLKTKVQMDTKIEENGEFYLIKFINKNMISNI